MRRLKRFRNWLGYFYSACWALSQRFVVDTSPTEERADEEGHSAGVDAPLSESGPTVAAEASGPLSEVVESSMASAPAPAPVEPAQVETVTQIEQVAAKPTTPDKTLKGPTLNEKEPVAPIAEPKKVFTPAPKVAKAPQQVQKPQVSQPPARQPPVASPSVTVSSPKTEAPQGPSANVKPQCKNGATASTSTTGKYEPGAVNDQTAQRLARLLVSEIKLYYKSKTERENGSELINIYDMLKDPIDKSRQHYKARMGEKAMKAMPDYFHGELVRSLCGGDPSRLGPNYQARSKGLNAGDPV
jgi:hypothetical protein